MDEAISAFHEQINDLQLTDVKFKGPVKLNLFEKKYPPKKNHQIFGWYSLIEKDTLWLYVDVDSTFNKETSVSFSSNFFKSIEKLKKQ